MKTTHTDYLSSQRDPELLTFLVITSSDKRIYKCLDTFFTADLSDMFEILVVFNGSTAEYEQSIQRLYGSHKNLRLISIPVANISYARNVGILKAKGSFIALYDSDSYIEKDYITKLRSHLQNQDIIQGQMKFEPSKTAFSRTYATMRQLWYSHPNRLYSPNIIFNKRIYENFGLYNPDLSGCEDSEFSERLPAEKLNIERVPDLLMHHQPDTFQQAFSSWKRYGKLASFLGLKQHFYEGKPWKEVYYNLLLWNEKYKLSRGILFFMVLYLFRFTRRSIALKEMVIHRDRYSHEYFKKTYQYLNSKEFRTFCLDLINVKMHAEGKGFSQSTN